MVDGGNFVRELERVMESKRQSLGRDELAKLKDSWKLFQLSLNGLQSILIRKGSIHEDPYRDEMKISDITNPSDKPFQESERGDQMSLRLSQYVSYVEFLNNYYQFDTEFLTLGRIKRMLTFVKYINFTQLTEASTQPSTRGLAELVGMVKKGGDQLSAGIIGESVNQLEKTTRDILAGLKALSEFQREAYKLDMRNLVLAGMDMDANLAITHRDEALRKVKARFPSTVGDRPFIPELITEILDEDWSDGGPGLREALLGKLAVATAKKKETRDAKSHKVILIDGIRILAGAGSQVEDAITKLAANSAVIESADHGIMAQIRKLLQKFFGGSTTKLEYEIFLPDPLTGEKKGEDMPFVEFVEDGTRKSRLLSSLLQRSGPTMQRLETAGDEHVFKFLERNLEELQLLVKRMNALDDHFKAVFPGEEKGKFKGIKAEITTIKNCIIKANQKRHEYHAQVEEEEQLRRLGAKLE
jgi:hypothetical protein